MSDAEKIVFEREKLFAAALGDLKLDSDEEESIPVIDDQIDDVEESDQIPSEEPAKQLTASLEDGIEDLVTKSVVDNYSNNLRKM